MSASPWTRKHPKVTNLTDPNNGKMVNRLRLEPSILDGLTVGANVLVDSIDAA